MLLLTEAESETNNCARDSRLFDCGKAIPRAHSKQSQSAQRGFSNEGTAMRAIGKTLIGMAAAVVCVSAAVILAPTTASAQDIGGMMRGFGVPVPYGVYRGPPARRPTTATAPSSSQKNNSKDSDEEDSDSSSSKSAKNSDKNSSDKNADKNNSDKSANADNKSRRQLSNAKDDGPAPSAPAPAAKAEPAKATVDDEPSFSPSR
jgi:hypothetical protein